jgi:hypothetical protein
LGAVAFLGKLYCVFGKLALGSISLMRICLFMHRSSVYVQVSKMQLFKL